ncbi:MAG TPA: MATE family efflux transporter [Candidatus Limiplasma sp.]|nr:MATE family efflux transporter [Candidatus Limiplasma sp.]HRX08028.1 MATE family efflux transporter [Candidatus Limiplasma sp.]
MRKLFVRDKHFYKIVLMLAIPVVLQNMITIAVNLLDTIMLGNYGEIQLSGASLANEMINLYQILCMGIGGGAAVLTAQYWGAGDGLALRKVVSIMVRISMSIALLFSVAALTIPHTLMYIYTNDPAIVAKGAIYFRISAVSFLFMGLSQTLTIVLRSVRLVKVPLYTSFITFAMNLFLNWVLIFGKLGAPEMQIAGAALATTIARLFEMLIISIYTFVVDKRIGLRVKDLFTRCGDYLYNYLHYSVPVIISDFLLGMGNTVSSIIMGHLGASFVAANAIVSQVARLSTVMNQGIGNAGSILTGNTLGENKPEKAYAQGVTFFMLSLVTGIAAGVFLLVVCPLIISSYNITEETRMVAYSLMYAISIMVIFQSTQSMLTKGVLRGGGDTRFLMVADIVFMWLASLPLGYLAGFIWHLSPFWIYLLLKVDYLMKTVLCLYRLRSRKWIRIVHSPTPLASPADTL